jgi:small conductance mechanosensitive channel
MYYIPNIKFSEENVENYYSNDKRRIDVEVLVDYSTDIIKAKMIITKILETFPNILKVPELDIIVEKLDDN